MSAAPASSSSADATKPQASASVSSAALGSHARLELLPCGAVVVREFLNADEQRALYGQLYDGSKHSEEHKRLNAKTEPLYFSAVRAFPFAVWKNVYTERCNIPEPTALLKGVNAAIQAAHSKVTAQNASAPAPAVVAAAAATDAKAATAATATATATALPSTLVIPSSFAPDNVFAQLYPNGGTCIAHQDTYLDWVASLSLGNACEFRFAETKDEPLTHSVTLQSGDLLLINGGALYHAVTRIVSNSAPKWWADAPTFGCARCNLQMRDRRRTPKDVPSFMAQLFL